jgi:hypothetical protein
MQAMTLLKPDEACLSHTALARLVELGTLSIDEVEWSTVMIMIIKHSHLYLPVPHFSVHSAMRRR